MTNGSVVEFGYREDGNWRTLIDLGHVDTILTSAEGGLGPLPIRLITDELSVFEKAKYLVGREI